MIENLNLTKDLNDRFKNEIGNLKNLTLDQERFNSLISQLISDMSLDENFEEEKKDEKNDNDEKQSKPQNQEQLTKEKDKDYEEMSIDAGIPDLENQAEDSDQADEEIETSDNSRPDLRQKGQANLGDLKYKTYTKEFDEIIKAEELESIEELTRLRKKFRSAITAIEKFYIKISKQITKKIIS